MVQKQSYKLIVSRYKENIDWVNVFDNYQIYNKGLPNLGPKHEKKTIHLVNYGRESHSYLYHIINNYDNLEDILIFSQGNYKAHSNYSPEEFKNRALDIDAIGFSTRITDIRGRGIGLGDNSENFTLSWHGGPLFPKEHYNLGGWWEKTIGEKYIRSKSVYWGGIFSVKKEFILKRSKESYQKIFDTLDWAVNPLEGHFCERSWFNILNLPLDFSVQSDEKFSISVPELPIEEKFDLKEFLSDWNPKTLKFEKKEEEVKKSPKIKVKFKDYKTYLSNQIADNLKKIDKVYVGDSELNEISKDIKSRFNPTIGICHGSRNGYEVLKLKKMLNCEVLGTDISDTAKDYNLVQHDFHELKEEWIGKFDFVYTNSLDHAYDPNKAIENWTKSLNEKGLLYIEHTNSHANQPDLTDCFSAEFDDYVRLVNKYAKVIKVINLDDFHNENLNMTIRDVRVIVASNYWKEEEETLLSKNTLLKILDKIKDLMFEDEETVLKCTTLLRANIDRWAKKHSPVYRNKYLICKADLDNKKDWFVDDVINESMTVKTSGTTTGFPFEYMRWHHCFHKLEWDNHYNVVLDEFEICENPHVLYFFADHYKKDGDNFISCFGGPSDLAMNNHGSSRSPIVHYVNFEKYSRDQEGFFYYLFDYVKQNKIDVFFTSAPQVNSLCNYIKKFKFKDKIAHLLSNTNERLLQQDARFLFIDNDYFDYVCDHMKCWDGGAGFFTCKHRNYHLMDNTSWVEEIEGKMISTDYFNLASPFVRYWNGDYCKVKSEFKRCDCGRLYREFDFLQSRPFSLKGICLQDIKDKIKAEKIQNIKQVRCSVNYLDVVSDRELTYEEKIKIASSTDKFEFRFIVESHY